MKKILFLFILIYFFFYSFAFAFEFYYEYLTEIDKNYFLVSLEGSKETKKYLCNLENLDCLEKDNNFSLKPKTFINYFVNNDGGEIIAQIKIGAKNFLTLYSPKNNSIFEILNFNQKIDNVFFSQEKSKLLIKSNETFYLFSLEKNKIIKKFNLTKPYSYLTPSPSLKYLAFYRAGDLENRSKGFFIFDIESEKNKEFLVVENKYWDLLTENLKLFDFISDEKLVFLSDHQNYQTLYIYDLQNKSIQRLFSEDFVIKDFVVYKDKIFFTANKENPLKWDLYEYSFNTQEIKKLIDYVVYDFNLTIVKNHLIFKINKNLPPQIYLLDLSNYELKRPKIINHSEIISLGEPQNYNNIWYVILKPESFSQQKEYDLIIWLHGGPYRQTSLGYHPYLSYGRYDYILERLRKNGFLIIKIDYPGSFGYGREFAEILKNNIGKIEVEVIKNVTKEIEKNFKIKRKYLMGNSYGGYLALKTIYEFPELFDGAISINGVSDWWTLIKNNPRSIFRIHFDGPPNMKNIHLYDQAGLFHNKNRLRNKNILLIHGKNDLTIPPEQAFIFLNSYKNVAKIYFQNLDEGHIIKNKDNLERIFFLILLFTKL